jgi:hypothetical protein
MSEPQRTRRWLPWLLFGYALLVGIIVGAMIWAKHSVARLSSAESISDWQHWRADVKGQEAHPGPVARSVPKSAEPPALVLLRDKFAVLMVGALFFSSMLYWIIAWFVLGILSSRQPSN